MKERITKGQLASLLADKISHQLSKLSLENTKQGLEKILESLNTDDLFDARAAAQQDIEQEFGADEFPEFGSMEDPKAFVKSVDKAPEKGANAHASAWKEHYSNFNEKVTAFLTADPQLAAYSEQNAHEFLDSMAVAMYKYMMDHNSNSPFISSVQQWIIDLNDTFDPTNEETGEVDMDPVAWRIYKLLGTFAKQYNRSILKARTQRLAEHRSKLKEALTKMNEAWDWSHSPEADDAAKLNLYGLPHEVLLDIMSEWDAYEAAGGNSSVMAADFDAVDKTKYARLPQDVLVDAIFAKAEAHRTADNGGFHLWMCPYGCNTHKVSTQDPYDADREANKTADAMMEEDIDDMDIDGGQFSDDPQSLDSMALADDVDNGYYVVPPTDSDPYWYVVNADNDPVGDGHASEEEAMAAKAELEQGNGYGTLYKESRIARMSKLLDEAQSLINELSNYPMGAMDAIDAPYNQVEPVPARKKPKTVFSLTDADKSCVIVHHGGDYYAMDLQGMDGDTARSIMVDFVGVSDDGPIGHYSAAYLPEEAIVDYINDNVGRLKIGNGLQDWEAGMSDLVKIDPALAQYLKADHPRLSVPV
jgi:hypothetical protein